jgi:hypothetical protein
MRTTNRGGPTEGWVRGTSPHSIIFVLRESTKKSPCLTFVNQQILKVCPHLKFVLGPLLHNKGFVVHHTQQKAHRKDVDWKKSLSCDFCTTKHCRGLKSTHDNGQEPAALVLPVGIGPPVHAWLINLSLQFDYCSTTLSNHVIIRLVRFVSTIKVGVVE